MPPPIPTVFDHGVAVDSTGITIYDIEVVGLREPGRALAVQCGVWSLTGPVLLAFAWYRDEQLIAGANRSRYVVTLDDAGLNISCVVTVTSPSGYAIVTSKAIPIAPNKGGGASSYAPYPAPSGYRWDFVTYNGARVTYNAEPVVALIGA